jgi:GDP-L-fucose synthase
MKPTLLITGGTGLVGSALKDLGIDDYYCIFLSSKTCDLTDFTTTYKLFENVKPEYVIHLAACVGGLFKNMTQKVKMLEDNLAINTNVLKCSKMFGVRRLVACLSTCIFPDNIEYPITVEKLNDGPPHDSNSGYAYAKRILEFQCRTYNQTFGTNFVCVVPTNMYGPHDNFHPDDSHVIPALIRACHMAKIQGKPFVVRGSGKPLRQFMYSGDFARFLLKTLESKLRETSIIAPSEEFSICELAHYIKEAIGYDDPVTFDESFSDGQYRKTVVGTQDFDFTSLEDGIQKTVDWYLKNLDKLRV